ncbi:hypothetical protein MUY14_10280 [Amycolatopsis sp. FBCC-B4732]|uniref:hypothetical protein n=1 Tax=Amycolatopsis sp. FBCC-B4732 TaxID=3079339 RepID=UPI001FF3317F|nr:hypothetical protein [Amycolatopsis sp. FBCC-B4732]UOX90984.1 hypothetical protein MUY14_10280 [Amycolatopsis sp. FBCC-B4732]
MSFRRIAAAAGLALTVALSVATPASAAPVSGVAPASAAVSPVCSGTGGWGKIAYQVCVRYNCDHDSCLDRGYLGLVNRATSARTVHWELETSLYFDGTEPIYDDSGSITLAAGEQRTIFARLTYQTPCGSRTREWLKIQYDSAGWSPAISVSTVMPCV